MKNMNLKEALEIIGKGKDLEKIAEIRDYMRIDVNTKGLKKAVNSTVVEEVKTVKEVPVLKVVATEEESVTPVVDITPITKPSDRFDIDDYIKYQEYMIKHGGKPSIEDYFRAIEYYKNRA